MRSHLRPARGAGAADAAPGARARVSGCSTAAHDRAAPRRSSDWRARQAAPCSGSTRAPCRRWLGEVAHQGVVAEVAPLPPWTRGRPARGACARPADPLLLALDGVQDPHNLGACLRTADACGALARHRAARPRGAAQCDGAQGCGRRRRDDAGGHGHQSRRARLKLLKDAGLWIVGADAEGRADMMPVSALDAAGCRLSLEAITLTDLRPASPSSSVGGFIAMADLGSLLVGSLSQPNLTSGTNQRDKTLASPDGQAK